MHFLHILWIHTQIFAAIASLLWCTCSSEVLVKLLSVSKFHSYVDIYPLLHWIFYSLWLIYNYSFLTFIQLHRTYSWYHIRWIYTTPISLEYNFLAYHRSNPFVSNLISAYEFSSYVDIAFVPYHFLTIKQIMVNDLLKYLVFTYPF